MFGRSWVERDLGLEKGCVGCGIWGDLGRRLEDFYVNGFIVGFGWVWSDLEWVRW